MLAHQLVAHGIGGRTVRELNEGPDADSKGMDADEFMRWAAFFQIEPFAEQRADVHVAMLMAQTYNMNRGKGKRPKKPKEFLPRWFEPPRPEMTVEQLGQVMRMQYLALGGDPNSL